MTESTDAPATAACFDLDGTRVHGDPDMSDEARDALRTVIDAVQTQLAEEIAVQEHPALYVCRHCGRGPDDDGDHSCPCPYRDEECPDHVR